MTAMLLVQMSSTSPTTQIQSNSNVANESLERLPEKNNRIIIYNNFMNAKNFLTIPDKLITFIKLLRFTFLFLRDIISSLITEGFHYLSHISLFFTPEVIYLLEYF